MVESVPGAGVVPGVAGNSSVAWITEGRTTEKLPVGAVARGVDDGARGVEGPAQPAVRSSAVTPPARAAEVL